MNKPSPITPEESSLLERPTGSLIVFSDVFSNTGIDFDAELTTDFRHGRPGTDRKYGIGDNATLGSYGVDLIAQLLDDGQEQFVKARQQAMDRKTKPHHNVLRAGTYFNPKTRNTEAIRVIANNAPRSKESEGKNGHDFHLAILDNGLEVYVTPLRLLQYVRGRVSSLFRIPNDGHPQFDGQREQFRSSIIARSCEVPEHLVRLEGSPLDHIPEPETPLELAYADNFGNIRLRVNDEESVRDAFSVEKQGSVEILIDGIQQGVHAKVVTALRDIPPGEWGLYRNVADGNKAPFAELVHRWPDAHRRPKGYDEIGRPGLGSPVKIKTPALVRT